MVFTDPAYLGRNLVYRYVVGTRLVAVYDATTSKITLRRIRVRGDKKIRV